MSFILISMPKLPYLFLLLYIYRVEEIQFLYDNSLTIKPMGKKKTMGETLFVVFSFS